MTVANLTNQLVEIKNQPNADRAAAAQFKTDACKAYQKLCDRYNRLFLSSRFLGNLVVLIVSFCVFLGHRWNRYNISQIYGYLVQYPGTLIPVVCFLGYLTLQRPRLLTGLAVVNIFSVVLISALIEILVEWTPINWLAYELAGSLVLTFVYWLLIDEKGNIRL